jgi:putative transposase
MAQQLPVAVVCRVLGAPRSTVYARRVRTDPLVRPGPATSINDTDLVGLIHQVLATSPFAGEGYRKVRARLRREHGVHVSGKRVLRLLRREGLLAPQRIRGRRKPRPHDGTIIPQAPNQRWGTDATMAWTRVDGWVWVFACIDHYTAEAWAHVAKVGDRFAALQPVYDAVTDRWGRLGPDVARGLELRHDWGRSTARPISPARWPGSGSPTARRSWGSRRPTAVLSAGSAPSKTSACGFSCTTQSTSSARPWPASSTATTAHGSFSATATTHPRRPTRQHNRHQQHDRTDHESVQETGCCSGTAETRQSSRQGIV